MRSSARLHVTLHGMTEVVDLHGAEAGEAVVDAITARLEALCGEHDHVLRVGETSFVVVHPTTIVAGAENRLADRLCRSVSEPVRIDGALTSVKASVVVEDLVGASPAPSGIAAPAR